MTHFKIDDRTLQLLSEHVNLCESFTHTLRATEPGRYLTLRLQVERSKSETQFTAEVSGERHTLRLPNTRNIHLKLADFIEEIANGPRAADQPHAGLPGAFQTFGEFTGQTRRQLYALVCSGGALNVHMGLEQPVVVAIHRDEIRSGITAIISLGIGRSSTHGFTASGDTDKLYQKVTDAIRRIAEGAPLAAHAA